MNSDITNIVVVHFMNDQTFQFENVTKIWPVLDNEGLWIWFNDGDSQAIIDLSNMFVMERHGDFSDVVDLSEDEEDCD